MATWRCHLHFRADDGRFRWRRVGGQAYDGYLEGGLVPPGATSGCLIDLEVVMSRGRMEVQSCRLASDPTERHSSPGPSADAEAVSMPLPEVGQLRWARVPDPSVDGTCDSKLRPVVLVAGDDFSWGVIGLTTQGTFGSGGHRIPVPNYAAVGLSRQGYLCGATVSRVSAEDLGPLIGWADHKLCYTLGQLLHRDLSGREIEDLRYRVFANEHRQALSLREEATERFELKLTDIALINYFSTHRQLVLEDLNSYFHSGLFDGRDFEHFSERANRDWFDANDIAALLTLPVSRHGLNPSNILRLRARAKFDFHSIHRETPMWALPRSMYEPGGEFAILWDQLLGAGVYRDLGLALMASKFPHAIPIRHHSVRAEVGIPHDGWRFQWWLMWFDAMSNPELRVQLELIRDETRLYHVSLLRIAEVALWMETSRR